uniref:TetR/AcrR family transcriptional regulator n=1 Tax=Nocardia farcinica TaxID=37329 RepID=UPI002453E4F2
MPKTIDQEQRRAEIAAAVWRLIDQSGVSAVSLRTVAAEAGLVLGSLRHTFPTKADLLAYAMELVFVRAEQRVSAHAAIGDPRRRALAMLLELLPLDEQRRIEMRVDLALVAEAPAHPRLAELAGRAHTAVAALCHDLCADLAAHGLLHTARAVAVVGRRGRPPGGGPRGARGGGGAGGGAGRSRPERPPPLAHPRPGPHDASSSPPRPPNSGRATFIRRARYRAPPNRAGRPAPVGENAPPRGAPHPPPPP